MNVPEKLIVFKNLPVSYSYPFRIFYEHVVEIPLKNLITIEYTIDALKNCPKDLKNFKILIRIYSFSLLLIEILFEIGKIPFKLLPIKSD